MPARVRFAVAVLLLGGLPVLLAIAGISSSAASQRRVPSSAGKIHAHLTNTSFTTAKARTVKLVYSFSPASSSFGYRLSIRRGAKWSPLRSVKQAGRFVGSHALTVRALFGTKAVTAGRYHLGLNADANSLLIAFRVVDSAPVVTAHSDRPSKTVKLIFIHHSTGENWLADDNGDLGIALKNNNYFVSDTNYGWGPNDIGDKTDIGDWWLWFRGASSGTYLHALYHEFNQHASYSRIARDPDPSRENEVIMFKSCFPNSQISGHPNDAPASGSNPLRGQDAGSSYMTVANVKGIYNDLLTYFAAHQNKLFVLIVSPPLAKTDTDASHAANARAVANWLVNDWLAHYHHSNVAVFDFYNVLTSNGGNPNKNDLGKPNGNHHRLLNGAVQHIRTVANNFSAYPTGDSHPSRAGNLKATGEFVPLLNYYYHRWASGTSS